MKRDGMKQYGFFKHGGGINEVAMREEAKSFGFVVVICDGYTEIWR